MTEKCKHPHIEVHNYWAGIFGLAGLAVRCSDCHAIMEASSKGAAFIRRQRLRAKLPIPLERKYWKEFANSNPNPMGYKTRMMGYENAHMVRR